MLSKFISHPKITTSDNYACFRSNSCEAIFTIYVDNSSVNNKHSTVQYSHYHRVQGQTARDIIKINMSNRFIPEHKVTPTRIELIHDVAPFPSPKQSRKTSQKTPNEYVTPSAEKENIALRFSGSTTHPDVDTTLTKQKTLSFYDRNKVSANRRNNSSGS